MIQSGLYNEKERGMLESCTLCPHECRVDRFRGDSGICRTDAGINIASICIHRGEEPPISGPEGICNIFFTGCNLHCIFCQNHEISQSGVISIRRMMNLNVVLDRIEEILKRGIRAVGFVSPSHVVPQVKIIIAGLNSRGLKPVTVYNTNSYDKIETIKSLDGLIDVYLPDYKYISPTIAFGFSGAVDYPQIALKAIKEMYYQKGSTLVIDDQGRAEKGLMIRHLVLPGHAEESKNVLRSIAEELSPGVHISLMSQYHPTKYVSGHPSLDRLLYKEEYQDVVETMNSLGFRNGWVQDMESNHSYRPDFTKEHPFE